MIRAVYESTDAANEAAAAHLARRLGSGSVRNVMVAAGNTPLELYRRMAEYRLDLRHLQVFALDEYVGVPLEEPRNCANLLRAAVACAWGIPQGNYHTLSSQPETALGSVLAHEQKIGAAGGLDLIVLGLGQNGHLGFNEPGCTLDSQARLVPLEPISVAANRKWFADRYAPSVGVTVGMKTILGCAEVFLLAFGAHKTQAVRELVLGPVGPACPASFLRRHPRVKVFLDTAAAAGLDAGTLVA